MSFSNDQERGEGFEKVRQWVLFVGYLGVVVLVEALACRFDLYPITFFVGFLFGWSLVTHAYPEKQGRMTVQGDAILATMVIGVIIVSSLSAGQLCRLLPQVASCIEQVSEIRTICAFEFAMSIGISSFTLWLWFRIRQWRNGS